jgi:hypothetical protein
VDLPFAEYMILPSAAVVPVPVPVPVPAGWADEQHWAW